MTNIIANLKFIQQRIHAAEQQFCRDANSVKLLAVSKSHSPDQIAPLIQAHQQDLGENYVQEALIKISALSQKWLVWHFIGPIQLNKAKLLAQNFSWIHTVCRLTEAERLSRFRPAHLGPLNICIQVKLDDNSNKKGIPLDEVSTLITSLISLPNIKVRGLMTLPPYTENFEEQRKYFRKIKELSISLNNSGFMIDTLSMGMTHDMEAAIAEGATIVRIGTGIFGPRKG